MKVIKVLQTIILLIVTTIFCLTSYLLLNPQIKKQLTVNSFKNDAESMEAIAREWNSLNYTYMFTDKEKFEAGLIVTGYNPNENISVANCKYNLENLLINKKYKYIMKSNNAVFFTKYASLGNGYGIAFSEDGNKPQNEFILSSEKTDSSGKWYFYIMR